MMGRPKIETDKRAVQIWLNCFNYIRSTDFVVDHHPDDDNSRPNVDAICRDSSGNLIAVEHTRIQAFPGEKTDNARFEEVLGKLDKHPDLLERGMFTGLSIEVGAIPKGVNWEKMQQELVLFLQNHLPDLTVGRHQLTFSIGSFKLDLRIEKRPHLDGHPGLFLVSRRWPGVPNDATIRKAFDDKLPKLARSGAARKILLFEQDSIAGAVASDVDNYLASNVTDTALLPDEIWCLWTAALETEQYAHAEILHPSFREEKANWSNGAVT